MSQVQQHEQEKVTTPDNVTPAVIQENTNNGDPANKTGEDCVLHIKADPNATLSLISVYPSQGIEEEESNEEEKVITPDTPAVIKENTNTGDPANKVGEDGMLHIKANPNATLSLKSVYHSVQQHEQAKGNVTTPDTPGIIKEKTNHDDLVNCVKTGEDCVLHIKANPNATPPLKSEYPSQGIEEEESSEEENESVLNVVINVAKNGLGVGIYFVASLMTKSGTIYTGILGLIACIISTVGFYWIGKACDATKTSSYEGIFKAAFGDRWGWICSVIISAFTFNVVLLYTLLLGVFAEDAFKQLGILEMILGKSMSESEDTGSKKARFILSFVLVLLTAAVPISFLKKISYFKYTSCIGLVGVIYSGVIHCISHYMGMDYKDTQKTFTELTRPEDLIHYFLPIAILSASFNCHFNAANYYKSVGRNLEKFKQVTIYSFIVMFAVVGAVAFFSYKNFGQLTLIRNGAPSIFGFCKPPYLKYLNDTHNEYATSFKYAGLTACFLVALNVAFGIGLCLFPLRQSVVKLWKQLKTRRRKRAKKNENEEITDHEHYCFTSGLLASAGILAVIFVLLSKDPDAAIATIAIVMDIAVSLFACHIAFTLPGLMYLKVQKNKSLTDYIVCIVLILSGIIACVTGFMKIYHELNQRK